MIALVPQGADHHAAMCGLILVIEASVAEEAVEPGGRETHRAIQARVHAIEPGRPAWLVLAQTRGFLRRALELDGVRHEVDPEGSGVRGGHWGRWLLRRCVRADGACDKREPQQNGKTTDRRFEHLTSVG